MQVVINKCFFVTSPLKKIAQIHLVIFEKKTHSHSEKMTSPNRRLGYLKPFKLLNKLKVSSGFRKPFD